MSGAVVWFTGLPASGKSTLSGRVAAALDGVPHCTLDSDEVRRALVPAPTYDVAGRDGFYETLARLAALLAAQGLVVLVPATAHLRRFRDAARALSPRFIEVHVDTPVEECARRDPKGLYAAADGDAASTLPGVGTPYEAPERPEVVAHDGIDEVAIERIVTLLRNACAGSTQ